MPIVTIFTALEYWLLLKSFFFNAFLHIIKCVNAILTRSSKSAFHYKRGVVKKEFDNKQIDSSDSALLNSISFYDERFEHSLFFLAIVIFQLTVSILQPTN